MDALELEFSLQFLSQIGIEHADVRWDSTLYIEEILKNKNDNIAKIEMRKRLLQARYCLFRLLVSLKLL